MYVLTQRVVDNSYGAIPRVYFESDIVSSSDAFTVNILGQRKVFCASAEEAQCQHDEIVERARRTLMARSTN